VALLRRGRPWPDRMTAEGWRPRVVEMQRGALELRAVEVRAAQVRAGEVAIEDGASKLRVVEVYHCRGGSRA
jgi:hypothetical protein